MISQIKKKVAVKIACIIVFVVTVISTASIVLYSKSNKVTLTEYLNISLSNAVEFSELVYSQPLWNFDYGAIIGLNRVVLENKLITAINIYDEMKFVAGSKKVVSPNKAITDKETTGKATPEGYIIKELTTPYRPPADNGYIKTITGDIIDKEEHLGKFELFYTEEFIENAVRDTNNKMVVMFGIIALLIIICVFFAITALNKPIIELAEIARQMADSRDFSISLKKKNRIDEIGILFNGFVDLIQQIRKKEEDREQLQQELQDRVKRFRTLFKNLQEAIDNEAYSHRLSPASETDDLTISLNKMLTTLEQADNYTKNQSWLKNGQAELNAIIGGEQRIARLAGKAINFIADYTGALVATIFIVDDTRKDFSLAASYAFRERKNFHNRFEPGQGLTGQAVLEQKTIVFTDIPEDYIRIESSLGNVSPGCIIVIPLVFEGEVNGVIELGTLEKVSELKIEFLETVAKSLAVAVNAAMFNDRLSALFERTKEQAEELKSQQEELRAANEELEEQTQILKESESKLQAQQEELQASNEELEEKTELLEHQKTEIQKTNRALELKQQQIEEKAEQLKAETQYKSEFLANMSHELRTPLNSLLILANMLAENEEENLTPDQIESAASIYRSGQNLLHLINDILDLSKIEAKRIELNITQVPLHELGSNFTTEFLHMAKEKNLDFTVITEEGLPTSVTTDVHRLEQVIRNLIGNAMKFTEQGAITLKFHRPEKEVRFITSRLSRDECLAISIIDTGEGIPEDKIQLIFEAFKQMDGSISRRHGGTGLGLSISKELTALLGGEIKVTSVHGKGSTFTIYIPQHLSVPESTPEPPSPLQPMPAPRVAVSRQTVQEPAPPAVPKVEEQPSSEPTTAFSNDTGEKTILIIEDDPEFSGILSDFFKKKGYTPTSAHDGEMGVKYAIEQRPTAIILDIGLPGIDGWGVLAELKNNSITRHIPVHIMSAFDDTRQGLERGAVGYLTKPVSREGLNQAFERIEEILSSGVKHLLVIEDNQELQLSIMKLMTSNDIRVTAANTGQNALDLLRSNKFDCMILDLGLPDITGFELLGKINEDPGITMIPVIIFTGRDLTNQETEELEKFASSIVLKSAVSMERLLDETALFLHRVESDMSEDQKKMIRKVRDQDSTLTDKNVLIVDDDMRNAFALNKFLKSKGMEVSIANNGEKALALLEEGKTPDIILMDIMMPVMDGYEAIRRIRKQKKFKDTPILALTAKAMSSDRDECIRCGANDYLSKPLDTTKLLTMLRVWLYA